MIPQPFVKGAGERVFFGQFEYPAGADIIFDFGNPLCTSAFNTSRIVYNVGSANITGSLIPFNNPGPIYPALIGDRGGLMVTSVVGTAGLDRSNYLQFDWTSSVEQTEVMIWSENGSQLTSPPLTLISGSQKQNGVEAIVRTGGQVGVDIYDSSNNSNALVVSATVSESTGNGRNGFNVYTNLVNGSTLHQLYMNGALADSNNIDITRTNSGSQRTFIAARSNWRTMVYMRYPKLLTPKEIRQIFKLFSQRFFT